MDLSRAEASRLVFALKSQGIELKADQAFAADGERHQLRTARGRELDYAVLEDRIVVFADDSGAALLSVKRPRGSAIEAAPAARPAATAEKVAEPAAVSDTPEPAMPHNLEFALRYAQAGYKVMPVRARGKTPMTAHGAHDATGDAETLKAWWTSWPDANVAITLDGLVCVDIDPRNGGDIAALPGSLPDTCYARTGGGGWHYLYRANGARYAAHPAAGVDVKSGPGAYIVVEPSTHPSGDAYNWLDETEPWAQKPAKAPAWLEQHEPPQPERPTTGQRIAEGARNNALTSLAGTMQRRGMTREAIEAALLAENAAKCEPPLPEADVRRIAASVARYTPANLPTQEADRAERWPASLDLAALAAREPEQPRSITEGLPCGYATGFAGHGGVGKSAIALHLAVCVAAAVDFFGQHVERRRVLYLSCEDREGVLHWRLDRICAYLGVDLASLTDWLHIVDLVGHDAVLWDRDPRTGGTVTPAFTELAERVECCGTELLIVDGTSDTFAGNENSRTDVKRYVNALLSLIPPDRGALLLVGHVDKASAKSTSATTEGYSGSTAWHNSVRARWYLYPETAASEEADRPQRTGSLILELQKSNLGPRDLQMRFQWDDDAHLFVGQLASSPGGLERGIRDRTEREGVLACIRACACAVPPIDVPAAMTGPRTALHVLKVRPEFPESLRGGRPEKRRFWRHIEQLRAMGIVRDVRIRRGDRHYVSALVLDSHSECGHAGNAD